MGQPSLLWLDVSGKALCEGRVVIVPVLLR
jgi:hypothetical protein